MSPPALLTELQSQLHDTQSSLATHIDKVRVLETVFAEHGAIKREVGVLRQLEWRKALFGIGKMKNLALLVVVEFRMTIRL
jgi:hypothetical protein